jgi:hypothetical protein
MLSKFRSYDFFLERFPATLSRISNRLLIYFKNSPLGQKLTSGVEERFGSTEITLELKLSVGTVQVLSNCSPKIPIPNLSRVASVANAPPKVQKGILIPDQMRV